jgi:prepilin-type N-terminal cleavage/methylation domain-containing protein
LSRYKGEWLIKMLKLLSFFLAASGCYGSKKKSGARGFSLVEISVVIVILGIAGAVSYPSLSASYNRSRINSACFDIISVLKNARSLSVSASEARVYGVLFKPDGEYRIYSLPADTLITAASFNDAAVAVPYGEKFTLDSSVSITNFDAAAPAPFFVVFRDDGVPSADGINIPLPDGAAQIKLSSLVINIEMIIKISKSSGIAEVK